MERNRKTAVSREPSLPVTDAVEGPEPLPAVAVVVREPALDLPLLVVVRVDDRVVADVLRVVAMLIQSVFQKA